MWEQCIALEHGVDRTLVGTNVGDVYVVDEHAPTGGLLETSDHSQRCGLAATRRAQQ